MSFNQRKLWEAMQHPRSIDSVDELEAVVQKYPYFQLARTLLAKVKHDQQAPDAYDSLGKAAIYAPDRRLLRRIFYDELTLTLPDDEAVADGAEPFSPSPTQESVIIRGNTLIVENPDDELADEEEAKIEEGTESDETKTAEAATESVEANTEEEAVAENREGDDKQLRDELEETLRTLQESKAQLPDSTDSTAPQAIDSPTEGTDEPSMDMPGMDMSGTPTESPNPPRDQQQEIIDKFVQANPSIRRDHESDAPTEASDLAARSSELPDNLVTENLAEIMRKQGKTGKAIALYEKLMLKYPEKKTYFAGKIDQLKN